jgi:hypothetical protein
VDPHDDLPASGDVGSGEIQRILAHRPPVKLPAQDYLVEWKGIHDEMMTWIPRTSLVAASPVLLAAYEFAPTRPQTRKSDRTMTGLEGSIKTYSHVAHFATTRPGDGFPGHGEAGGSISPDGKHDLDTRNKSDVEQYLLPQALDMSAYMKKVRTKGMGRAAGPQYSADQIPREYGDGKFFSTVSSDHCKRTIDLLSQRQVPRVLTPADVDRMSFEPMKLHSETKLMSRIDVAVQKKMVMLVKMMVERHNKYVERKQSYLVRKDMFLSMLRETMVVVPRGSTRQLAAFLSSEGEIISIKQADAIFDAHAKRVPNSDLLFMDEVGFRKSVEDISAALNVPLPIQIPQVPGGGEWQMDCHIRKATNYDSGEEDTMGAGEGTSPEIKHNANLAIAMRNRNNESEISGELVQGIQQEDGLFIPTMRANENSEWLSTGRVAQSDESRGLLAGGRGDLHRQGDMSPSGESSSVSNALLGGTEGTDHFEMTPFLGDLPFVRQTKLSRPCTARHGEDMIAQAIAASETADAQSKEVIAENAREFAEFRRPGSNQGESIPACKDADAMQGAKSGLRPGESGNQGDEIFVGTVKVIDFSSMIQTALESSQFQNGSGGTGQAPVDVEHKHSISQEKSREVAEAVGKNRKWTSLFVQYHDLKTRKQAHTSSKNAVMHASVCMLHLSCEGWVHQPSHTQHIPVLRELALTQYVNTHTHKGALAAQE